MSLVIGRRGFKTTWDTTEGPEDQGPLVTRRATVKNNKRYTRRETEKLIKRTRL